MDYFGSNIGFLLKKNQIVAQDLAEIVDLTDGSISNWRKNVSKPKFKEIIILLDYFKLTFEELFLIDLENSKQIENLNEFGEEQAAYGRLKEVTLYIEKECALTGAKCAFAKMPELEEENRLLRKENEALKKK